MKVGIPREVKDHEYRVAITPAGVHELTGAGHQVAVLLGWLVIGGLAAVLAVARRRVAATTSLVPARTG